MLLVISPAKTLDYDTPPETSKYSIPDYLDDAQVLIKRARKYSRPEIMKLMAVSEKIAELNCKRFKAWHTPFTPENSKQAILAFKGDVYSGLDAETFSEKNFEFAQQHLRILSGLYGLLRPLDLIQPYRLEMGRKIDNERGKNLYEFWGETVTEGINTQLKKTGSKFLINLASNEYFKVINTKNLDAELITPAFKDYKNGQYKMMGVYAKKARGQLSRFVIENQLTNPEDLKKFNIDGYLFNEELTDGNNWVFTRSLAEMDFPQ